jgi:neutral amino acid transport system permease protein
VALNRRHRRVLLGLLVALLALLGSSSLTAAAGAQEDDEDDAPSQVLRGILRDTKETSSRDDDEPVEGVGIIVRTAAGEEVEVAATDEDGLWEVEVPGPGDYEVEIEPDTLPDGIELRNPDTTLLVVHLNPAQSRTVNFPLGADTRNITGGFENFLQKVVLGISFGLIVAMMSIGLSLVFGTTELVNFAHAEMVTFGALVAYFFNQTIDLHLVPAAILAVIIGGVAGGLFDLSVWRPLRRRRTGLIAMMVVSIGLSILFRYLFLYQFGGRTRPYGDYFLQRAVDIGPVSVAPRDLWSIGIALSVLIAVGLLLQLTRLGKGMRAVADNPDLAASSGIDVDRVILAVWIGGGALAALGGVLLGLAEQVGFEMGFKQLLLVFAGVTLGGLGTAYGALVGGFIIGLVVQVSTVWVPPELNAVSALMVLIGILLVRPQGILGRAERIG